MIKRDIYLQRIYPYLNKPVIKIITGIRRCGKSVLLQQIMDQVKEDGISEDRIVYINKELIDFDFIKTYTDLHEYVISKTKGIADHCYLCVDEVQEIEDWEKAINSFFATKRYDIFLTGSNAHLLSTELATYLSGRYVEIPMFTLSYPEFLSLSDANNNIHSGQDPFDLFLRYGGFPGLHAFIWDNMVLRQFIHSIYSTILLKDIVVRYNIRDAAMLEKILEHVIDNCGNITTAKNISDFVKSQYRKVSPDTVQNYIGYALNALLIQKVRRYDIKGKKLLETHEKYFLSDIGIKMASTGFTPESLPGQLENAVLLHLLIAGYQVSIGKINDAEVDFVATRYSEKIYLQVCTSLNDEKVIAREYGSLEKIPDHFIKMVISLDSGFDESRKGIRWMNIKDFLLRVCQGI